MRPTAAETLAAALRDEPDPLSGQAADCPEALDAIVSRCLEKRPQERFQSAGDLAFALRMVAGTGRHRHGVAGDRCRTALARRAAAAGSANRLRPLLAGAALGLIAGIAGSWAVGRSRPRPLSPGSPTHLSLELPAGAPLVSNDSPAAGSSIAISQDGRWLAYVVLRGDVRRLVIRSLDRGSGSGTPRHRRRDDSAVLTRCAMGRLLHRRRPEEGARLGRDACTRCARCRLRREGRCGPTMARSTSVSRCRAALRAVASTGGRQRDVTTLDLEAGESNHLLPEALPGSKALLMTVWKGGDFGAASIWSVSLATGVRKLLLESAAAPRYVPPGFLVFARGGALFASASMLGGSPWLGETVPVVDGVWTDSATGTAPLRHPPTGPRLCAGRQHRRATTDRLGGPARSRATAGR